MELINIEKMASLLGISPKTLYRWVKQGRIPYIKLAHHLRFEPEKVLEHFRARTQEQAIPTFQSDSLMDKVALGRIGPNRSLKS